MRVEPTRNGDKRMRQKILIGESNGFKIVQNNGTFFVTPIPISLASKILSIDTASWDNKNSKFIGINREVIIKHKKEILGALENRTIILPNAIIAYIENEYFSFTEIPGFGTDHSKFGKVKFFKAHDKSEDSRTAVILDGQHRFTALSEWMRSAKEDFPLYVVFFHEPSLKDGKNPEEFEKLCLEVMSQVNKSKPLSDSEQKLIIARTKEVASNSKIKEFITLITNELDGDQKCPLKYEYRNKKPANKKSSWLKLSVWVNAIANAFNDSHSPRILQMVWVEASGANRTITSSAWEVKICVEMIKLGLQAIYGLCSKYWENKPAKQRLYHNVGIRSLISIIDVANASEELYSRDPARQFYRKISDTDKVIQKLQIALLPILKIKWEADKSNPNSMIEVKQQQDIDLNFSANLCKLVNEFSTKRKDWTDGKDISPFTFDFVVKNSNSTKIYEQKIEITYAEFKDYENTIEDGGFMPDYKLPVLAPPKLKEKKKQKKSKS